MDSNHRFPVVSRVLSPLNHGIVDNQSSASGPTGNRTRIPDMPCRCLPVGPWARTPHTLSVAESWGGRLRPPRGSTRRKAEAVGLEPTTECAPYPLSRRAPDPAGWLPKSGTRGPRNPPGTTVEGTALGGEPRASPSASAQRELNPHICLGKAAGGHYIMGAARKVCC